MSQIIGKLRWTIVGLGSQAERLAEAIWRSENGVLYGVVSKNPARAAEFAKKYEARKCFDTLKSALDEGKTGAILVASPNFEHAKQCIMSVRADKPVLCEKPLSLSSLEGLAILKALRKNPVKFAVGFHLRFHPLIQEAKKIISSPRMMGGLRLIEINWSIGRRGENKLPPLSDFKRWREDSKKSGGGAVMSRGVHLFDLLRFLTGREVEEVAAFADGTPKAVEETAVGIFKLGDAFAYLSTSRFIPNALNVVTIYGGNGRLILRDVLGFEGGGALEWTNGDRRIVKACPKMYLYKNEVESFAEFARKVDAPMANITDGLKSVAITEAFYRSIKSGKTIVLK